MILDPIAWAIRYLLNVKQVGDLPFWWDRFAAPLVSIILVLLVLYALGLIVHSRLHRAVDWVLLRLPLVTTIYKAIRNVFHSLENQVQSNRFQRVVLVEFPHPGMRSLAFVTNSLLDAATGKTILCVCVLTGVVPPAGFTLFVPEEGVTDLGWSVNQTLQAILSGGITVPSTIPFSGGPRCRRPPARSSTPRVIRSRRASFREGWAPTLPEPPFVRPIEADWPLPCGPGPAIVSGGVRRRDDSGPVPITPQGGTRDAGALRMPTARAADFPGRRPRLAGACLGGRRTREGRGQARGRGQAQAPALPSGQPRDGLRGRPLLAEEAGPSPRGAPCRGWRSTARTGSTSTPGPCRRSRCIDADGNFLKSWGEDLVKDPHHIRIDPGGTSGSPTPATTS